MEFFDTGFLRNEEICLRLERTATEDKARGWLPAYYFSICLHNGTKVGSCDLRIGYNKNIYYGGNIGYQVDAEYRGHHYAGKACGLLFELARLHDLDHLFITCNPDNFPSRRTCEYAGGVLEGIVDLPKENEMYLEGERQKCIYRFDISDKREA